MNGRPLRPGYLLLWVVFIAALLLFLLTLLNVGVAVPAWALWLALAILAGAMLFP